VHDLPLPRFEAAAAVSGGRVYFIGGITGVTSDPTSARESHRVDVYDPETDTWTDGPPLPDGAPSHHLAVTTVGDLVYVLGGFNGILGGTGTGAFVPNAGTYVLDGGAWRRLADQPVARGAATAQALGPLIVVAGGGPSDTDGIGEVYAYHWAVDAWTRVADMPYPRQHVASCALEDGMLVMGGWTGADQHVLSAADLYDPVADSWTAAAPLPTARGGLGAVTLDGRCRAVGGELWTGPIPGTFDVNEVYDPAAGTWTALAPMPAARHGIGVARMGEAIYVVGGGPQRGNSYTAEVDRFDP
jgi:N-acetylneuraminic acid mutarotase